MCLSNTPILPCVLSPNNFLVTFFHYYMYKQNNKTKQTTAKSNKKNNKEHMELHRKLILCLVSVLVHYLKTHLTKDNVVFKFLCNIPVCGYIWFTYTFRAFVCLWIFVVFYLKRRNINQSSLKEHIWYDEYMYKYIICHIYLLHYLFNYILK